MSRQTVLFIEWEIVVPSELHEKLCSKGVSWLKRNGFCVASLNVWGAGSRERVDCIGFRQQCSALIEVKVSRSDFMADMKKPERQSSGVGTYRFYLAPAGLLRINDLPDSWGLIEADGRTMNVDALKKNGSSASCIQLSIWSQIAVVTLLANA